MSYDSLKLRSSTAEILLILSLLSSSTVMAEKTGPLSYNPQQPKALEKNNNAFIGIGEGAIDIDLTTLKPISITEIQGRVATGFVHTLPSAIKAAQLHWEVVNGVATARIHITTSIAKQLRLHLTGLKSGSGMEFRLIGNDNPQLMAVSDEQVLKNGEIWLPLTTGNAVDLEIVAPDTNKLSQFNFLIDKVNIILFTSNAASLPNILQNSSLIVPKKLGYVESVEYDVACLASDSEHSGINNAAAATALISFIDKGESYSCSGTLLNDMGNTQTPWFTTANHCISNQTVANTVSFEWFFQADACDSSKSDSRYSQTFGGAKLLWTNLNYDFSFFQLKKPPGVGTVFSGWDNSELIISDLIYGVHHPKSDQTMVSFGTVIELLQPIIGSHGTRHTLDNVHYQTGGTEEGSSGSGLFSKEGNWQGTLFGGAYDDYQDANYSPFRKYYGNIKPWLNACSLPWGGILSGGKKVTAYTAATSSICSSTAEIRVCNNGVLTGSYTTQQCAEVALSYPSDTASNNFSVAEVIPFSWDVFRGVNRKASISISKDSGVHWTALKSGLKTTWNWKITKKYLSERIRFRVCLPKTTKLPATCNVTDYDSIITL